MRHWEQWKSGGKRRRAAARRAAEARWAGHRAAKAGEPERETRVVEITIRDSHRPLSVVRLQAEMGERGWRRWLVAVGGERVGTRRFGRTAIADLLARLLQ